MLFNSLEFIIFFPLVFLLYWLAFRKDVKWQNLLLLVASYIFYGWWSWKFLLLLVMVTVMDYLYGFGVASENKIRAKIFLWLSVINNLGILCLFKYFNFFAVQFQQSMELLGIRTGPILLNIVLPIGISFYTFHGLSYVFDIYRKKQLPVKSLVDYAVFVAFFPLLVAGPIERANHLLPQVQSPRSFNYQQAVQGARLIIWGLFKKLVIADSLAPIANEAFNNHTEKDAFGLMIGVISFSFQIYGDFSGYSDIAVGTAKLLGFELLSNFKFPYFSRNIAEFWKKWHISLSSWFRDYLYIPLGGSREGRAMAIRNTFIIFLVSGFWHGASWNFIVWGGIHAMLFMPLLILGRTGKNMPGPLAEGKHWPRLSELRQMVTTFALVSLAWIFFRAPDLTTAVSIIGKIIRNTIQYPSQYLHPFRYLTNGGTTYSFFLIIILLGLDWFFRQDERNLKVINNYLLRRFVYIAVSLLILIKLNLLYSKTNIEFIYFQF